MTGAELITVSITDILDISSAASAEDADFRARAARYANKRATKFWRWKPWPWRFKTESITIGTDGHVDAPEDFASFGQRGYLTCPALKYALTYVNPGDLLRQRSVSTSSSARPQIYTMAGLGTGDGMDPADGTLGRKQIHVHERPSGDIDFEMGYEIMRPLIVDSDDTDPDDPSGLQVYPEDFHESVLLVGIKAEWWSAEGDGRAMQAEAEFKSALIDAWKDEKAARHTPRRATGRYPGARRWSGGW